MKNTLIVIGVIVGILGLTWIFQGNDFFLYKVFAPKYANVQRQVYENTDSYKRGMEQNVMNWRMEFLKADSSGKEAIASLVVHELAAYPVDSLSNDLRNFVDSLRHARLNGR